jgi:hypothetical protein
LPDLLPSQKSTTTYLDNHLVLRVLVLEGVVVLGLGLRDLAGKMQVNQVAGLSGGRAKAQSAVDFLTDVVCFAARRSENASVSRFLAPNEILTLWEATSVV